MQDRISCLDKEGGLVTQKATTHPAAEIRQESQENTKAHENKGFLRKTASGCFLLQTTQK
ncbi:MAG: hypothetical protein ABFC77_11140 [Thermoguttaceae bacterium]